LFEGAAQAGAQGRIIIKDQQALVGQFSDGSGKVGHESPLNF
jgi:hypothetical protein